jgi:hypothetical protein
VTRTTAKSYGATGHIRDAFGQWWEVSELRGTVHGFDIVLGWPRGNRRGTGGAGRPDGILTPALGRYQERFRTNMKGIGLPICPNPRRHRGRSRQAPTERRPSRRAGREPSPTPRSPAECGLHHLPLRPWSFLAPSAAPIRIPIGGPFEPAAPRRTAKSRAGCVGRAEGRVARQTARARAFMGTLTQGASTRRNRAASGAKLSETIPTTPGSGQ